MVRACLILIFVFFLVSCKNYSETKQTEEATTQQAASSTPSPTSQYTYEVKAWVNKPNPSKEDLVTVYGSLLKNGVYLGGMMMQATWPDPDQERGTPNCNVLVIYQTGVCTISAGKYEPGRFVPVQIYFDYDGAVFTGETGFTPK
jgi:hypothetical protein